MSSTKHLPPETFIPTPQRLMAIGQLCIAFSLLFWVAAQPFMGEYFGLRSRMLPYEFVMGTSEFLKTEGQSERQINRFKELPVDQKNQVITDYQNLQVYAKRPTFQKILEGLHTLILDIPPFEQAWIFFSITLAILILLKVEGAKTAAWLLPLIVVAYSLDNQLTGKVISSPDLKLFPTEERIIHDYLNEPLSSSLLVQKDQLEKGWNRYLIDQWSKNTESNKSQQLEEGEFHFTLARLTILHNQPRSEWLNVSHEKLSLVSLIFFLIWNFLFAWVVSRPSQVN